jgi:hypothetical protein
VRFLSYRDQPHRPHSLPESAGTPKLELKV